MTKQEPKRCGNCGLWDKLLIVGGYGLCMAEVSDQPMHADEGQSCPCWKAREGE